MTSIVEDAKVIVAYLGNFGPVHSTETHVAASLEGMGHEVVRLQEGDVRATDIAGAVDTVGADVFLWTQTYGLAEKGGTGDERHAMVEAVSARRPTVGLHLDRWRGLDREVQVTDEAFFRCGWVFTADGDPAAETMFAAAGVNHVWSPPGVHHAEAHVGRQQRQWRSPVAFVGSWQGGYHAEAGHRHELVAHLASRWKGQIRFWPAPGQRSVRGRALQDLYASTVVAVGDSCHLPGDEAAYISDRVPESLGRGAFLVHPAVPEVTDGTLWDGGSPDRGETVELGVFDWFDFDRLDELVDWALRFPGEARRVGVAGRDRTLECHTYAHRLRRVLSMVLDGHDPGVAERVPLRDLVVGVA